MLGYFLEEFDPQMTMLCEVVEKEDREQTRDVAHRAKGRGGKRFGGADFPNI